MALWKLDATELAAGIKARRFSCREVMESVVERIRAENPRLNAIVADLTEQALAEASAADSQEPTGPLHGVPVTIKINIDQQGEATTNGLALFRDLIAPADSPVVRNLRRAGAIVVGRTNVPELSMRATTVNPLYGRTRNPWSEDASPGGSSGGGGAAAAAGLGAIHHGNDIGGSLRFPAFANGVVGLKPSPGRVAAYNPSATAERSPLAQLTSVQGPMARSVADTALALRAMAMDDPRDPWWCPVPLEGPPVARPVKVAWARETYGCPLHPEIGALLEQAARHLTDAGYEVVEVKTPSLEEPQRGWFSVLITELTASLGPILEQHGSDDVRHIFGWYAEMGELLDDKAWRAGLADRTRMMRDWNVFLSEYPLMLSPFLMSPMFDWNYDAAGREQTRDVFRSSIYGATMNYLGLPAGVVPTGFAGGRPAGVQLVARRFREDLILDAMAALEARSGRLVEKLWGATT